MKAIFWLVSLLATVSLPAGQAECLARLTVGSGIGSEVYSNVTVTSVTATHIYFTHSLGLGAAKLRDLEPELQKRFHFDPVKAEAIATRQAQANTLYSIYQQELAEQAASRRAASLTRGGEDALGTTGLAGAVAQNPSPLEKDTALLLTNFAGHPLFPSDGPSKDDVFEGTVGDCYFMATVAALAESNPEFIRRTVTDMNDGTYTVRFFQQSGVPTCVRVNSDLWIDRSGGLAYARLGRQGSLWVPILEKAFALCRRNPTGYDSIYGGAGKEVNSLVWNYSFINIDSTGVDPNDVVRWVNEGARDGVLKYTIYTRTIQFLNQVYVLRKSGRAMVMGGPVKFGNDTPLVPASAGFEKSTYHRGQHVYMVDHVVMDANGNCTGIVLRDPWGLYRKITDLSRLFFCTGGVATVEPQG
jgi:hypothetical protein